VALVISLAISSKKRDEVAVMVGTLS
jgi:hypothetical protein